MANLLVLTVGLLVATEVSGNAQPNEQRNSASSGFPLPHFGKYICILLFSITLQARKTSSHHAAKT